MPTGRQIVTYMNIHQVVRKLEHEKKYNSVTSLPCIKLVNHLVQSPIHQLWELTYYPRLFTAGVLKCFGPRATFTWGFTLNSLYLTQLQETACFLIKILGPWNLLWATLVNAASHKWPTGHHLRTYDLQDPFKSLFKPSKVEPTAEELWAIHNHVINWDTRIGFSAVISSTCKFIK